MQSSAKYKEIARIRRPERRLHRLAQECGSKKKCERTGAAQPKYKMEGIRIIAEFPTPKKTDDDDTMMETFERRTVGVDGSSRASGSVILCLGPSAMNVQP